MAITEWQEEDRPRERLFAQGANRLSDAELLAITLRTGTRGKNAVELARELLGEFGSLRQLLNAEQHQLTHISGFGPVKFAQFKAIAELGQRYARENLQRGDALTSPEQTENYLRNRMRDGYLVANEVLNKYEHSYNLFVEEGQPGLFIDFLANAEQSYLLLANHVSIATHSVNFWRTFLSQNGVELMNEPFMELFEGLLVLYNVGTDS